QVVETEGHEQAVERAEDETTHDGRAGDPVADRGERGVEGRVDEGGENADEDGGTGRDDRHEAATAEEREVRGELDAVVLLVERRSREAEDDATEDAVVDELLRRSLRADRHRVVEKRREVAALCGGERRRVSALERVGRTDLSGLAEDVRRHRLRDAREDEV